MALDNKQLAQELISYTIVTDRNSIINLLKRNGVKLSQDPANSELTIAVLVANSKSSSFKDELARLLSSKVSEAGESFSNMVGNDQDFGFTGVDDVTYMPNVMAFTGSDDYANLINISPSVASGITSATSQTTKKPQTKVGAALSSIWDFTKTNILTKENINAGIQVGLNKINTDTLAKQNNLQLQAAALEQQQYQMSRQLAPKSGVSSNTILYVIIGVVALAGIGFVVYKSTKK
jgi:LPXTG-motif cell wall-anchored protein